jgi:hypothetical protein
MLLLFLFSLNFLTFTASAEVPTRSVDELYQHFSVEKQSIENLGRILDQMKRISYSQQLVSQGFHDVSIWLILRW